jgi:hypothetical protein
MNPTTLTEVSQLYVAIIWLILLIVGAGFGSVAVDIIWYFKERRKLNANKGNE